MNSFQLADPQHMEYCFDFVNTSCPRKIRTKLSLSAMYTIMVGAITLTIGGNIVVIISISHFKQLHSPTNFLILSLAATDLLLGVLVMPYSMVRSIESCWYLGDLFCKLHTSCDLLLSTTSIFHLCFISIDRYYAVCHPLYYFTKITTSVIEGFLLISWLIPLVFAFGLVFSELHLNGIEEYVTSVSCAGLCVFTLNKLWAVLGACISFLCPGTMMVCIYVHIFTVARKQAKQIDNFPTISHTVPKTKNKLSLQRESKAAQTLSIIMGVFLLCWFPFCILAMVDPFLSFSAPEDLYNAFMWLGYLNSTFNPIIYGLFYSWFRRAFKMIITGKIFVPDSSNFNLFRSHK